MDTARVSMIVLGAMGLVDWPQSLGSISQTEVQLGVQCRWYFGRKTTMNK